MSEILNKIAEIKAAVSTETAQVAAKIDELKAAIEAGQIDKAAILAELDTVKAGVEGIFVPDQPAE